MNTEKILKLADYLDTVEPEHFNMDNVWCGTAGCMLGHAVHAFPDELRMKPYFKDEEFDVEHIPSGTVGFERVGAILFDIDRRTSFDLFFPRAQYRQFIDTEKYGTEIKWNLDRDSLPQEAAAMLREFVKRHTVDNKDLDL